VFPRETQFLPKLSKNLHTSFAALTGPIECLCLSSPVTLKVETSVDDDDDGGYDTVDTVTTATIQNGKPRNCHAETVCVCMALCTPIVTVFQAEGENVSKLEKADILELTVQHLHRLRRPRDAAEDAHRFQVRACMAFGERTRSELRSRALHGERPVWKPRSAFQLRG
jgi:hypothetical protein